MSLSTEDYELGQDDLTASNTSLISELRQLGPGVLRIGGDTADESWWTSDSEPAPNWAVVTVTPADLERLEGFLVATGWRAVLTVDLGNYDPARAADEVAYATQILGSNLAGIEIGNEPNDYALSSIGLRGSGFGISAYVQQLETYVTAIEAETPGTRILGPDTTSTIWFDGLAQQRGFPVSALTEHYYPTSYSVASAACAATPTPTAQQLLSPSVWSAESSLAAGLVSQAGAAGLPAEIDETNDTSSCDEAGGPDTSPVFASAIWAMDWSLRAASAGVSSVAFHDEFGTCGEYAYSPLCASGSTAEAEHQVSEQPEFYGLLSASQLEGGQFVPVNISGAGLSPNVSAYATVSQSGVTKVAVINASFTTTLDADVTLPSHGDIATALLDAPSPGATSGVSLAEPPAVLNEDDTVIDLPPVSAAVITLTPDRQTTGSQTAGSQTATEGSVASTSGGTPESNPTVGTQKAGSTTAVCSAAAKPHRTSRAGAHKRSRMRSRSRRPYHDGRGISPTSARSGCAAHLGRRRVARHR